MSDSEYCTVDAMPSAPRDKENVYKGSNKETKFPMGLEDEVKKEEANKPNSSPPSGNKYPQTAAYLTIINSPYAHIGNNIVYNPSKPQQETQKVKETEKMMSLKKSTKPVLDKDIDALKDYIGSGWKNAFILLGLTDPQIYQYEAKFREDFNGLIRALFVDWRQANGKAGATVGKLARALWESNQHIALYQWSLKYDELHK